ncbi:mitochondrial distribution and morphology protein [Acrasis kona]|uniref:Mitochondrial distribution and morphology protein n=1 Tax=Acrasis kona TaxID=1008807 RepID=A0AAW2YKK1_9EUKA
MVSRVPKAGRQHKFKSRNALPRKQQIHKRDTQPPDYDSEATDLSDEDFNVAFIYLDIAKRDTLFVKQ